MHVIIQAGGKGTRLEGLTRNRPKCLVPVNNRPMIFWAFQAFKDYNIKVICDYKADALVRYLDAFGRDYKVEVVNASGTGTASGIAQAIAEIQDNEPIVVLWCDLLFNEKFKLPKCLETAPLADNFVGLSAKENLYTKPLKAPALRASLCLKTRVSSLMCPKTGRWCLGCSLPASPSHPSI